MPAECRNQEVVDGELVVCDKITRNHRHCSGWSDRHGGYVDWQNPSWTPPKTADKETAKSRVHELARKVPGPQAAAQGSERAAQSWTPTERLLVESAITLVAEQCDEFTTDQIWIALGDQVPKTAGMAAMLKRASAAGFIEATEKYADSQRERDDHDHGRRLRVWRSRMR